MPIPTAGAISMTLQKPFRRRDPKSTMYNDDAARARGLAVAETWRSDLAIAGPLVEGVFTNTVRIQRRQGGDWVRAYMTRHPEQAHRSPTHPLDRDRDFVAWSAAFTMEQLERWTASCRADMEAFARVGVPSLLDSQGFCFKQQQEERGSDAALSCSSRLD